MQVQRQDPSVVVEEIDVRALSEPDLAAYHEFWETIRAEARPEDPPTPIEMTRADLASMPSFLRTWCFAVRGTDGGFIALGTTGYADREENRHLMWASIDVLTEHRRRGIGTTLLRSLVERAEKEGRTLLIGDSSSRLPSGEAFARRLGADAGLAQHTNRLLLENVDRALVDRWIEEGPQRAPGYTLIHIDGAYPDELLEEIAALHGVMNTAPRDELDVEDEQATPEQIREWEANMFARGTEAWSLFVRHDDTGELIAFTEVGWNPATPAVVGQMGTAVRPDHRGRALGKWMKATMLKRILDERPEAAEIRTGNADSNDAMLGINRQLGFEHYIARTVWQLPVERARAYLDSST